MKPFRRRAPARNAAGISVTRAFFDGPDQPQHASFHISSFRRELPRGRLRDALPHPGEIDREVVKSLLDGPPVPQKVKWSVLDHVERPVSADFEVDGFAQVEGLILCHNPHHVLRCVGAQRRRVFHPYGRARVLHLRDFSINTLRRRERRCACDSRPGMRGPDDVCSAIADYPLERGSHNPITIALERSSTATTEPTSERRVVHTPVTTPNRRKSRSRLRSAFELRDVELLHLKHGLHRFRVPDEVGQTRGDDLP